MCVFVCVGVCVHARAYARVRVHVLVRMRVRVRVCCACACALVGDTTCCLLQTQRVANGKKSKGVTSPKTHALQSAQVSETETDRDSSTVHTVTPQS